MTDIQLCFIDLETCGLDEHDPILEVAMIATDKNLRPLVKPFHRVVKVDVETLTLNEKVRQMHTDNHLLEDCAASRVNATNVFYDMRDWMKDTFTGKPYMAGSGVHFDRRALRAQMRGVHDLFHYRNFPDVSGLRRAIECWLPERVADLPVGNTEHRALQDVIDAFTAAQWFKTHIFSEYGLQVGTDA